MLPGMDAAGIDRSTILTGSGNDAVMGFVSTENDAGVDANGDGVIAPDVYLDASALNGGPGGFDGIRNSVINTGGGSDGIYGSASGSAIDTGSGNDLIHLDRARNSSLDGGFGNDTVKLDGPALGNTLRGGFGNDTVQLASGEGNRLDGGFGQDLITGGAASSTSFRQSNAGAALDAAVAIPGAPPVPPSPSCSPSPASGRAWGPGRSNFSGSRGSSRRMGRWWWTPSATSMPAAETSSSSAAAWVRSIRVWQSQGAIFGVQNGQLVVRDGAQGSQLGVVIDTLAAIRSLGIGSPSLAYATDTRQLMFDADGNWKAGGSQSLGTLNLAGPDGLNRSSIQFGSGA